MIELNVAILVRGVENVGNDPCSPRQGGYFMIADIKKKATNFETDENECKDQKFVKYMTKEKVCYNNLL